MMEAVRTSETSVDNNFTRQYIPEDNSEHHTRRRENLKSHENFYGRILRSNLFQLQRLGLYSVRRNHNTIKKCDLEESGDTLFQWVYQTIGLVRLSKTRTYVPCHHFATAAIGSYLVS
jgi:hypothetical protein